MLLLALTLSGCSSSISQQEAEESIKSALNKYGEFSQEGNGYDYTLSNLRATRIDKLVIENDNSMYCIAVVKYNFRKYNGYLDKSEEHRMKLKFTFSENSLGEWYISSVKTIGDAKYPINYYWIPYFNDKLEG
jgi:hypothetical protein